MSRARQLSPEELQALAQRMVDATTPAEQRQLKQQIIAGFYGVSQRKVTRLVAGRPTERRPKRSKE